MPRRLRSDAPWIVLLSGNELNAGMRDVAARRGARLLVVDWHRRPAVKGHDHLRLDIKDSARVVKEVSGTMEQAGIFHFRVRVDSFLIKPGKNGGRGYAIKAMAVVK